MGEGKSSRSTCLIPICPGRPDSRKQQFFLLSPNLYQPKTYKKERRVGKEGKNVPWKGSHYNCALTQDRLPAGLKGLLPVTLSQFLLPTGAKGRWWGGWGWQTERQSQDDLYLALSPSVTWAGQRRSTCWWPDNPLLPGIAGWNWECVGQNSGKAGSPIHFPEQIS